MYICEALLQDFSRQMGTKMDDPASKANIRKFVKAYKGQLDVSEIEEDLDSFSTFNEFFYRRLKKGCRPISHLEDDSVFVSAADCRMMAFDNVDQAKQFWIKVCSFNTSVTGTQNVFSSVSNILPPHSRLVVLSRATFAEMMQC